MPARSPWIPPCKSKNLLKLFSLSLTNFKFINIFLIKAIFLFFLSPLSSSRRLRYLTTWDSKSPCLRIQFSRIMRPHQVHLCAWSAWSSSASRSHPHISQWTLTYFSSAEMWHVMVTFCAQSLDMVMFLHFCKIGPWTPPLSASVPPCAGCRCSAVSAAGRNCTPSSSLRTVRNVKMSIWKHKSVDTKLS